MFFALDSLLDSYQNSISELNKRKYESKCFGNLITKENNNKKDSDNVLKANLDRVKISHKNFGVIESYAAITTEGLYRYEFINFLEITMKIE